MCYNMLKKAVYLLTEYQIFDYPVDKDTIGQVVSDKHLKFITLKNLSTVLYIGDTILMPKTQNNAVYDTETFMQRSKTISIIMIANLMDFCT